ncbi:Hypothetical protein (Fragment) [Durusdinium trenchii]|uniref:Uncharacterized protein n=1 Tax=Durusdinium trenchii TaxID=1381693 RepID=A0ABP0LBB9_9DINO
MQNKTLQRSGSMVARQKIQWPKEQQATDVDAKADLRGVHWQLSYLPSHYGQTETKEAYIKHPRYQREKMVENGDDLRAPHIDLAFGASKSCKHWVAALTDEMSRNEYDKFHCKKPDGFEALGAELRKSHISFGERSEVGAQSHQKMAFGAPPKVAQMASFADTVGKDLRASHIDIANGAEKSCGHWKAVQTSEMAQYAREKFSCRKPEGFYHLIAELRKSSVPLGGLAQAQSSRS